MGLRVERGAGRVTRKPTVQPAVHGALNVGVTRAEILEVLIQVGLCAGFPAALNAVAVARGVFGERSVGEAHEGGASGR